MSKFVCFLRGINVGGHKRVKMDRLREVFASLGFSNIRTLLASGNVVFEGAEADTERIPRALEWAFGFEIETVIVPFQRVSDLVEGNPFSDLEVTSETRLFVTFSSRGLENVEALNDGPFRILRSRDGVVLSALNQGSVKTPEAMKILEKIFGKSVTTRSYKTVQKIAQL